MLLDKLKGIMVENDVLEIFGESGTGKTTFCRVLVEEAMGAKKKILYIDTEKNMAKPLTGLDYVYIPDFKLVYKAIQELKDGYDLIILDSIGLPILGEFASLGLNERGNILLQAEAIAYKLKKYSQKNDALIVVTTQPESKFGKDKGHVLRPFGDKSMYFYKEVWKTDMVYSQANGTSCIVKAFRSRVFGRGKQLFRINIGDAGVQVDEIK